MVVIVMLIALAIDATSCGSSADRQRPPRAHSVPSLARLAQASLMAGSDITPAEAREEAMAWHDAIVSGKGADDAFTLLVASWRGFKFIDAESMARDFEQLSDGMPATLRARLAIKLLAAARREEQRAIMPPDASVEVRHLLERHGILPADQQ